MSNRRAFLKTAAAGGGLGLVQPIQALASRYQTSAGFFGVHPFVENNPNAVFIMKTNVDVKTNHAAKTRAGLTFARSVLVPSYSGIPLTHLIPIKPNITYAQPEKIGTKLTGGTVPVDADYLRGIVTDPYFVEGIIKGIKELGVSAPNIHVLDAWDSGGKGGIYSTWNALGYTEVATRTGVTMKSREQPVGTISENEIVWVDTPNGTWFRNIPYLYPVNAPNTWLLGVAKFKAHGMGITMCLKNIQGALVKSYQSFCTHYDAVYPAAEIHLNPNRNTIIKANYDRHMADKIPRWDKSTAINMEAWTWRTMDNNLATKVGLSVVEGIYGRDGNGFLVGPNSGPYGSSQCNDYLSNIIIFGINRVYVDIIGHWLAGHEPGNFGFLHIAKETGLSKTLNPANIPVFEWKADGTATLTPLTDFKRTPLKTPFLQKSSEPSYHLCNEPFTYPSEAPLGIDDKSQPTAFVLHQNRPNPFNPNTSIEYSIPRAGNARLEVFNSQGQLVEVLADGFHQAGKHLATWNTHNRASGTYFYRFLFSGFRETKKMVLLK